jgi:hypothetical protein
MENMNGFHEAKKSFIYSLISLDICSLGNKVIKVLAFTIAFFNLSYMIKMKKSIKVKVRTI